MGKVLTVNNIAGHLGDGLEWNTGDEEINSTADSDALTATSSDVTQSSTVTEEDTLVITLPNGGTFAVNGVYTAPS